MATWKDELRQVSHATGMGVGASFRGVPFRTTESETSVGRRNVLHEYPQRDVPWADDLGRRARQFQVNGHVIGKDYLKQRDALIKALETPGPGELMHPRFGLLNVVVTGQVSIRESHGEGGVARFAITFAEAGENTFPQAKSSTRDMVHDAADLLGSLSVAKFASLANVAGVAGLATDMMGRVTAGLNAIKGMVSLNGLMSMAGGLTGGLTSGLGGGLLGGVLGSVMGGNLAGGLVGNLAGDLLRSVSAVTGNLATLIRTPETLALQMQSLYQQVGLATNRPLTALADLRAEFGANDRAPWAAPSNNLGSSGGSGSFGGTSGPAGMVGGSGANSSSGTVAPPTQAASVAQREVNRAATETFVRAQVVAAQARVLTDAIGDDVITTAQDARAQSDLVLEQIDHEVEAYDPPADVVRALIQLRVAIVRDVSEQAERLQQRSTYTTQAVLPALLVAQRIYQDATRAEVLTARNQVRHPLFVPAGTLEVLR